VASPAMNPQKRITASTMPIFSMMPSFR
jgi:hypothetical protein